MVSPFERCLDNDKSFYDVKGLGQAAKGPVLIIFTPKAAPIVLAQISSAQGSLRYLLIFLEDVSSIAQEFA